MVALLVAARICLTLVRLQRNDAEAFSHEQKISSKTVVQRRDLSSTPVSEGDTSNSGSDPLSKPSVFSSSCLERSWHLLSLPCKNDTFSLPAESLLRECWKWKDVALGDGRDYFVPRPRALTAFQSLFLGMEVTVSLTNDKTHESNYSSPSQITFKLSSNKELYTVTSNHARDNGSSDKRTFIVEECAALSNCARLDVILILKEVEQPTAEKDLQNRMCQTDTNLMVELAARFAVAFHLRQQTTIWRSQTMPFLQQTGVMAWFDLAQAVSTEAAYSSAFCSCEASVRMEQCFEIQQLSQRLSHIQGPSSISSYICFIASGLAPRPNRPSRDVIFRPYSSRDAHILLQLKRTEELVSVWDTTSKESKHRANKRSGRINVLLKGALSAGKAARNENIVPEIRQLREFGSEGTPPKLVANRVAEAAIRCAVVPAVSSFLAQLTAMETAHQISELRQRISDVVISLTESERMVSHESDTNFGRNTATDKAKIRHKVSLEKIANKLLHGPTIQLRAGKIDPQELDDIVYSIERKLKKYLQLIRKKRIIE